MHGYFSGFQWSCGLWNTVWAFSSTLTLYDSLSVKVKTVRPTGSPWDASFHPTTSFQQRKWGSALAAASTNCLTEGLYGYMIQSRPLPGCWGVVLMRSISTTPSSDQRVPSAGQSPVAAAHYVPGVAWASGGRAPGLSHLDRRHLKGQPASTARSSIKTVQSKESKSAVLSVAI